MLITSACGVAVNIVMGCTLHQHGHSHGGGSSHSHDENLNVRAAYIHVIGDFIQSIGVLLAALLIYFKPEWKLADPICTFLFSILVLFTTFAIMKDALHVLMEGLPSGYSFSEVHTELMTIDGVKKVHNLRIWSLSLDKTALSVHLAVKSGFDTQQVLKNATAQIRERWKIFEMTIQIEDY